MKLASFLIFFPLYSSFCFSQTDFYPCKFQIVDSRTKDPVSKATVTIDQASLKTMKTDDNGFCEFRAVPVGRIDVSISHPDYRSIRIQNTVSSEVKNNSFIIELVPNSESSLLIIGKIENKSGTELSNVIIEVKVDGKPYKTVSDESGNYQFDIPLKTYRSDRVQMEFKKGICRYSEEVQIPETRYLARNVIMTCDEGSVKPDMNGVWELTIYSAYYLNEKGPTKVGFYIGGTLNLTQKGNSISGNFGSRNWIYCANAEINGTVNSDNSIQLKFTCTKGDCMNNAAIIITGNIVNNSFTGKADPSGDPKGKCTLYIGNVSMKKL